MRAYDRFPPSESRKRGREEVPRHVRIIVLKVPPWQYPYPLRGVFSGLSFFNLCQRLLSQSGEANLSVAIAAA
jgi:hypothetical protein